MLNLTREERQVALFLITVALVGMGIDFFLKKYTPVKTLACLTQDIGKINLNTADKDLLKSIPGIGEKIAKAILEYREKESGFQEIEELKKIKGITEYRYEKIKDSFIIK